MTSRAIVFTWLMFAFAGCGASTTVGGDAGMGFVVVADFACHPDGLVVMHCAECPQDPCGANQPLLVACVGEDLAQCLSTGRRDDNAGASGQPPHAALVSSCPSNGRLTVVARGNPIGAPAVCTLRWQQQ